MRSNPTSTTQTKACYRHWTPASVKAAIERFVATNQRFPTNSDLAQCEYTPKSETVTRQLGRGWKQRLSAEFGVPLPVSVVPATPIFTKESVSKALDSFISLHGRLPTCREMGSGTPFPGHGYCQQILGKEWRAEWRTRYRLARPVLGRKWEKGEIDQVIVAFIKQHRRLPSAKELYDIPSLPGSPACADALGKDWRKRYAEQYGLHLNALNIAFSEADVLIAIIQFVEKNNRLPSNAEQQAYDELPSPAICCSRLGVDWRRQLTTDCDIPYHLKYMEKSEKEQVLRWLRRRLKTTGIDWRETVSERIGVPNAPAPKWTHEEILDALVRYVDKVGAIPTDLELVGALGLPAPQTVRRHIGDDWRNILANKLRQNGIPFRERRRIWAKETILEAVEAYIKRNHEFPQARDFCVQNHLPATSTMAKHFGNHWSKELEKMFLEAGVIERPARWTDELVKQAIVDYVSKYGEMPRSCDLNASHNLPSQGALTHRLGKQWRQDIASQCGVPLYPKRNYKKRVYTRKPSGRKAKWTKDTVMTALVDHAIQTGYVPITAELLNIASLPPPQSVKRCLGKNWRQELSDELIRRSIPVRFKKGVWTKSG